MKNPMKDYAQAIAAQPNREEAIKLYAAAMGNYAPDSPAWVPINHAIIQRWSVSGLEYIKKGAWKRCGL